MIEQWRRWSYKRYETRVSAADDFGDFEQWASGPWTPELARKMPWDVLIKGPQLGALDAQTRRVIDWEIDRRFRSHQPFVANFIAIAALAVALLK